MHLRFLLTICCGCGLLLLRAQSTNSDTLFDNLDEVVVTATRTEVALRDVSVPLSVVTRQEIEDIGAPRLTDVLREQTGLQIVSDHGTGVQMQGMGSDYVMIMINGEPLIGRSAGTLDLDRISVNNIERIEILKGPSSALYGSEAMAGAINIITRKPEGSMHLNAGAQWRSFNTSDYQLDAGVQDESYRFGVALNRFSTDGVRINEEETNVQFPSTTAYTVSPYLEYRLSKSLKLDVTTRLFNENQASAFIVSETDKPDQIVNANGRRREVTILPKLLYTPNSKHMFTARQYMTSYRFDETMTYEKDATPFDDGYFAQYFNRTELQHDFRPNQKNTITSGLGYAPESVSATRYDEQGVFHAGYAFVQHNITFSPKLNLQYGGRYDIHNAYENRFSPKVALQVRPHLKWAINASVGGGYKAPDFRQLLLDFTNPVAGYSVFGANTVVQRMGELQQAGMLDASYVNFNDWNDLRPENSLSYNLGTKYTPNKEITIGFNAFYNQINDLIETFPVGRNSNGGNIFSYRNISRVETYGTELTIDYKINRAWRIGGGYEYLRANDLDVLEALRNGDVFRRTSQGATERVPESDYFGLFNRSRHSGNIKVGYTTQKGLRLSLRGIYRGAFPFADLNGNQIADTPEELAPATFLMNLTISKRWLKKYTLEGGVNNALGQINPYEPTIAGRIWFVGARVDLHSAN